MQGKMKICLFIVVLSTIVQSGDGLLSDLLQRDSTARALPVQMDMASEEGITICTGQTRGISCRDGANMAITNAFWGRTSDKTCPSDDGDPVTDCIGSRDTLPLVKRKCEGKKECKLSAKHKQLQNDGTSHCAGVNKYLIVNYTCEPESQGVTLCDSVETDLFCRAGWVMDLADVFWGRRAGAKTCGGDGEIECDASESAGVFLKKRCNGLTKCHIKADAEVLDPKSHSSCNGVLKYLMVNYICKPKEHASAEDDDVKDDTSKELMGMLKQKVKAEFAAVGRPSVSPSAAGLTKTKKTAKAEETSDAGAYKNIKKDETPTHESTNTVVNEESLSAVETSNGEAKAQIPTEDKVELSEPNTVRSILDRAKEVLKTLDYDGGSESSASIAKRGGIARKKDEQVPTSKFVNETAKAVKQVAALAQTLVKHAEAKALMKNKTKNLLKKDSVDNNNNNNSNGGTIAGYPKSQKVQPVQQFKRSGFIVEAGPGQFGNTP